MFVSSKTFKNCTITSFCLFQNGTVMAMCCGPGHTHLSPSSRSL